MTLKCPAETMSNIILLHPWQHIDFWEKIQHIRTLLKPSHMPNGLGF
jgi:hypothetical protein